MAIEFTAVDPVAFHQNRLASLEQEWLGHSLRIEEIEQDAAIKGAEEAKALKRSRQDLARVEAFHRAARTKLAEFTPDDAPAAPAGPDPIPIP